VSTKMSLELVSRDGVNVFMGVVISLPPVGCCSIELVRSKKDFLAIRALGNHEFFLNSLKPIFGFHWVLGQGECGRVSSQEFPKPGLRWWWWWLLLLLSLVIRLELVYCLEHCLHQLVLRELLHLWVVLVGLCIVGRTTSVVVPHVHHLRNGWRRDV
jgi:hypothetical protein